ncbi:MULTISPECIES: TetR/AcrR family transcriptional regulator [Pseudonocardia]|uniref:Bacterial regulatory protein n=2 Tax=Pseudonocardia TaxID=1847 RepID=A0A1Y2N0W9_PSEAH|nr:MULTISPECIES: helix-turn-helix domain-containing protein [Pseudonocardia]OSY40548.1 Bacterial regulatory protein [Pseudonocardia autotrophica]TDN73656.1 TetR family transcriptional regulator [Pseudonocardia autotrophica]BBG04400.1 hypothetical protein Pdca_56090 [Pseudonocardia autotrophica]GEC27147.1 hypothetical protein PSA01_41760 [Pseudonocardia saturnea]
MPLPRFDRLPAATRTAILAVARDHLAREGRDGASLNAIAVDAGFSRSAAYTWFDGRDDLFDAVRDDTVARLAAALGDWTDAPDPPSFWAALARAHRRLVAALDEHPEDRAILAVPGARPALTGWLRSAFGNAVALGLVDTGPGTDVLEEVTVAAVEALDSVELARPGVVGADTLRAVLERLWGRPGD